MTFMSGFLGTVPEEDDFAGTYPATLFCALKAGFALELDYSRGVRYCVTSPDALLLQNVGYIFPPPSITGLRGPRHVCGEAGVCARLGDFVPVPNADTFF